MRTESERTHAIYFIHSDLVDRHLRLRLLPEFQTQRAGWLGGRSQPVSASVIAAGDDGGGSGAGADGHSGTPTPVVVALHHSMSTFFHSNNFLKRVRSKDSAMSGGDIFHAGLVLSGFFLLLVGFLYCLSRCCLSRCLSFSGHTLQYIVT